MKDFWNSRYEEDQFAYGTKPNQFFKDFIDQNKPGKILLPGDGEGRNGVYAAQMGWEVDAFDFSESAKDKAMELAAKRDVTINYFNSDFESVELRPNYYDVIALIYVHIANNKRRSIHKKYIESLKPGGYIVFEAFTKEQLKYQSGGPKKPEMLYDLEDIKEDFKGLSMITIRQETIELNEGLYHQGNGDVIRLIAQKI